MRRILPIYQSQITVYNYDELPPGYYYEAMRTGKAPQRFWHQLKFNSVISKITSADDVLDYGCGPGSFLALLGEGGQYRTAVGVDIASNQIGFAKKNIGSAYPPEKLRFESTDFSVNKLPFASQSFDAITLIEVIEHIHPYLVIKLFQEFRRILKPKGRIIVTTPNYRSAWPIIEFLLNKFSKVKYHDQHINKYTPNSFVKFLETAGLRVTALETIFVISPFLSSISWPLAEFVMKLEKSFFPYLGSLLIAEAQVETLLPDTLSDEP